MTKRDILWAVALHELQCINPWTSQKWEIWERICAGLVLPGWTGDDRSRDGGNPSWSTLGLGICWQVSMFSCQFVYGWPWVVMEFCLILGLLVMETQAKMLWKLTIYSLVLSPELLENVWIHSRGWVWISFRTARQPQGCDAANFANWSPIRFLCHPVSTSTVARCPYYFLSP